MITLFAYKTYLGLRHYPASISPDYSQESFEDLWNDFIFPLIYSNCNAIIASKYDRIINVIGHYIAKGIFDNMKFKFIIENDNNIEESIAYYDKDGYVVGFPFGYFDIDFDSLRKE